MGGGGVSWGRSMAFFSSAVHQQNKTSSFKQSFDVKQYLQCFEHSLFSNSTEFTLASANPNIGS